MRQQAIPLPPIDEQRRIVDILDRAASIRALRRQAQETTNRIIPALFVKMFGDPAANPMEWLTQPLGELIAGFEGGKNLQADSQAGAVGALKILKISAVTSGVFRPDESKPAPRYYEPPKNHFVRKGDLLVTRANTAELVGATTMVFDTPNNLLLPDKIWRIVWRPISSVLPHYLLAWFKQPATRAAMSRIATGTSASMRNISQARLVLLPVPVPPAYLQRQFEREIVNIERTMQYQSAAAISGETISNALAARLLG